MSDDIVTRLRDSKLDCDYCDSWHINGQAADEIERLRAEVVRLGSFIHPIGTVIGREAVRGASA